MDKSGKECSLLSSNAFRLHCNVENGLVEVFAGGFVPGKGVNANPKLDLKDASGDVIDQFSTNGLLLWRPGLTEWFEVSADKGKVYNLRTAPLSVDRKVFPHVNNH